MIHKKITYKCKQCEKTFTDSGNLKRHVKAVHEGTKDYKCDYCGKSFSEPGKLKRHVKAVHS